MLQNVVMHIEDIDEENKSDIYMVSDYAVDIFSYYKHREVCIEIYKY